MGNGVSFDFFLNMHFCCQDNYARYFNIHVYKPILLCILLIIL